MRSSSAAPSGPHTRPRDLPVPPKTHDPIMYGKVARPGVWPGRCCGRRAHRVWRSRGGAPARRRVGSSRRGSSGRAQP
nr:hypothetical protein C5F59_02605 [Streptomyces sp. QL37]